MLRIGTIPDTDNLRHAEAARLALHHAGISAGLVDIPSPGATPSPSSSLSRHCVALLETSLLRGEIDFFTWPLHELSTQRAEGTLLAGLSARSNPAAWLLVHGDSADSGELFGLANATQTWASSPLQGAQLRQFRPDVQIAESIPVAGVAALLGMFRRGTVGAWLVPAADLDHLLPSLEGLHITRFNPRELLPPPGSGVLAHVCCRGDMSVRKALKPIHHPETALLTNVERKILRLLGDARRDSVGAWCERDAAGYYHAWACLLAEPGRVARSSQSTHYNLAERIVEELLK